MAQAQEIGNALAELEKNQAACAIDYISSFMTNFTVDGGNKWNQLRNNIFVPMAILLLLPGALLTQVRAIIAAGNPAFCAMEWNQGEIPPWEGIQRSIIAIFLIPGTYLVVNYTIDVSNSITYTISSEYRRIFGTDMYRDAICSHIRAFPERKPAENRNAFDLKTANMTPLLNGTTPMAMFEGRMIETKIEDPCVGIYLAPRDRADEAVPSGAVAVRTALFTGAAGLATAWNICCAFQMVYFYYLWFVGPITAALWVWPLRQLRSAFPSWVEGVITLGFWSLFWNTTILLMACFKGVDETGTLVTIGCLTIATTAPQFAFNFASQLGAMAQQAVSLGKQVASEVKAASKQGGGGGGKGGTGAHGKHAPKGAPAPKDGPTPAPAPPKTGISASASTASPGAKAMLANARAVAHVPAPVPARSSFPARATTTAPPLTRGLSASFQ